MSQRFFVAWFDDEHALVSATAAAREQGLSIHDVYTPFAVHGIDEAMGIKRSRLPWICFTGGVLGLSFGAFMQYYASVTSWALNVGGKPFNSAPAFLPVAFEMTVLAAALLSVLALLIRARLYPRVAAPKGLLSRVTDDRFALCLVVADERWNEARARAVCATHGAVDVTFEEITS